MVLADEQHAILAHVVVDPQAWIDHAVETFGVDVAAKHLSAKCAKHQAAYEAAAKLPGYQTRAEREATVGPQWQA